MPWKLLQRSAWTLSQRSQNQSWEKLIFYHIRWHFIWFLGFRCRRPPRKRSFKHSLRSWNFFFLVEGTSDEKRPPFYSLLGLDAMVDLVKRARCLLLLSSKHFGRPGDVKCQPRRQFLKLFTWFFGSISSLGPLILSRILSNLHNKNIKSLPCGVSTLVWVSSLFHYQLSAEIINYDLQKFVGPYILPPYMTFVLKCWLWLLLAIKLEEISWRQKSRYLWLKLGDKDTWCFHKMVNAHWRYNQTGSLEIDDSCKWGVHNQWDTTLLWESLCYNPCEYM